MGKKLEFIAHILARKESYMKEPQFTLADCDLSRIGSTLNWMHVGTMPVTYEIPDTWNLTGAEIDVIQREKEKISAEFAARIKQLNGRLAELQCIENNPTEVA